MNLGVLSGFKYQRYEDTIENWVDGSGVAPDLLGIWTRKTSPKINGIGMGRDI